MGRLDRYHDRDVIGDALSYYGIRVSDTWTGRIVMDVLLSCCYQRSTPYSAAVASAASDEGLADDTMRRLLTDVLRPIIADSMSGRYRRLGVLARGRGVEGALEAICLYWARRTHQDAERVDTCRIVAPPPAPAGGAGAEVPPEGGTDVSKAVVS